MTPPDIRFSLANERTFLAYVRTSIGLLAAGVAVFHLLRESWAQLLLTFLLLGAGVIAVLGGLVRYRHAEETIRAGGGLSTSATVTVVAVAVMVVAVAAVLAVLVDV